MISQDTMYNVKNRSSSMVVYTIPELNLRREFAPGESKRISYEELEKLTFQSGGRELIENFLQLLDEDATNNLNINREPEYNMSEEQVKDLLLYGSLDAFLDALDFAPIGVIDLIKTIAVALPLSDLNKRKALKIKTGFDLDKALMHIEEEKEAEQTPVEESAPKERRVKTEDNTTPKRRTVPQYNVVDKKDTSKDKE